MTALFSLRTIPLDVLLRALAISTVVLHHALGRYQLPIGLAGGMTLLMMLSGMQFARMAVRSADPVMLRLSIATFASRVFVPSLAAVVVYLLIRQEFRWSEVLFVRNWMAIEHLAMFPEWYVQMLLQLLLVLYLIAWIPSVAHHLNFQPKPSVLLFLVVALLARILVPHFWNTEYLEDQLPHMHAWKFALGAVVWFLGQTEHGSRKRTMQVLAVLCVLVAAGIGARLDRLEFWMLMSAGTTLAFVRDIRLPAVFAQGAVVVSSAAFALFLTHSFWFKVMHEVFGSYDDLSPNLPRGVVYLVAMVLGVAGWVAFTAFVRTLRAMRADPGMALPSATARIAEARIV